MKKSTKSKGRLDKEAAAPPKQADEALRLSPQQYQDLLNYIDAIVWEADAQTFRFTFVSMQAERLLGYPLNSWLSEPNFWQDHIHPEDRQWAVDYCVKSAREKREYEFEYRMIAADGHVVWLRDIITVAVEKGQPVTLRGLMVDITERKRAEEALQASEERFSNAFEHAAIGMALVGTDGRWLQVNQSICDITGYTEQELLNTTFQAITHPDDLETDLGYVRQMLAGEISTYHMEKRYIHKRGHHVWVLLSVSLVRDAQGTPLYFISQIQDITERKRMEEQLRQAHKMEAIGTLAGGIAHDFNNILTAILGFTDLAMDTLPEPHPSRANLSQVVKAGNRAKALVQQILAFSRQDMGEPLPVSLVSLITDALPLLRSILPTTIEIRPRLEPGGSLVLADATQMQQVVINLCGNAEYAMREKGGVLDLVLDTVAVDADFAAGLPPLQPGPHMRLTVRDTGRGMAPEILERVFDPFFTTKALGEGTGLGLSTAHGIVTNHGGAITVASTVGIGTTFEVYLPQLIALTISPASTDRNVPGGTERILFVDDEEPLVRLGEQMLTRLGYHVVAKSTSLEALDAFRAAPDRFDLVITDQTMPKMTGEALATELLRIRPDLPIILYTGFSHTMTPDKAKALGIGAFLMKPIVMKDLAVAIRRVLGRPAGEA
jgi:PAS domain S-box-containing protein